LQWETNSFAFEIPMSAFFRSIGPKVLNLTAREATEMNSNLTKRNPKVRLGTGDAPPRLAKHLRKVQMGTGDAPPRLAKHIPQEAASDNAPSAEVKRTAQVRTGTGDAPPRIVKHLARSSVQTTK
jgi:hypothetical protein